MKITENLRGVQKRLELTALKRNILILKQYARMLKLMQENAIVILRDCLIMEKYQR